MSIAPVALIFVIVAIVGAAGVGPLRRLLQVAVLAQRRRAARHNPATNIDFPTLDPVP